MAERTLKHYSDNAEALAERYEGCTGGVDRYFSIAFKPGTRILDIGCGSGRDVASLNERGFSAQGIDPCPEFVALAEKRHAIYNGFACDSLPTLRTIKDTSLDGILCSAVLMHLPEKHMFDAAFAMRRVLKEGGRLLLSLPVDTTIDPTTQRDENGRLFTAVPAEQWRVLLERLGFHMVQRWDDEDGLGRKTRKWTTLLFALESRDGSRSIDRIESILNRDRKVATYKLALFRALTDIAMTTCSLAIWREDGKVMVPLSEVSERWIEYYWPICESDVFVPQIHGATQGGNINMAFQPLLEELIGQFSAQGGLAAYSMQVRKESLSNESRSTRGRLLSKLRTTIKNGPVTHAGGTAEGSSVFDYDLSHQAVVMDAELWRDLTLMGSWIRDATILRWAELTARISRDELKPSQVIDLLLVNPLPERDVNDARTVYDALDDKVCVWSDKPLLKEFDIDHAIPFSYWRNNDLWNLLPAHPHINSQKSDRLPTRDLLRTRKDAIVHYWEVLHEAHGNRFQREAATQMGGTFSASLWKNSLFRAVTEAVEFTAIQRGAERWQPKGTQVHGVVVPADTSPQDDSSHEMVLLDYNEIRDEAYKRYLPLVGNLAAGDPFRGIEIGDLDWANECSWVKVPERIAGKNRFAIRVAGDSMEPELMVGDIVVFEYHRRPRKDRQIVILNKQELGDTSDLATEQAVKLLSQDDHNWIFESINPAYDSTVISKAETDYPILGTMVEKITHLSSADQA